MANNIDIIVNFSRQSCADYKSIELI